MENKKEGRNIATYIDVVLLIILLGYVIYAQIDGKFISKGYIETCNGIPETISGLEKIDYQKYMESPLKNGESGTKRGQT